MHGRSHLHPCRRPAPSLISSDTTCRPDGGRGGDVDDDDGASVTVRNGISGQSDPEYGLRRVPSISLTPAPLYHGSRSPTPTLPAKPQFFAGFHFWHKPTGPLVEEDMQLVWRNLIESHGGTISYSSIPPPEGQLFYRLIQPLSARYNRHNWNVTQPHTPPGSIPLPDPTRSTTSRPSAAPVPTSVAAAATHDPGSAHVIHLTAPIPTIYLQRSWINNCHASNKVMPVLIEPPSIALDLPSLRTGSDSDDNDTDVDHPDDVGDKDDGGRRTVTDGSKSVPAGHKKVMEGEWKKFNFCVEQGKAWDWATSSFSKFCSVTEKRFPSDPHARNLSRFLSDRWATFREYVPHATKQPYKATRRKRGRDEFERELSESTVKTTTTTTTVERKKVTRTVSTGPRRSKSRALSSISGLSFPGMIDSGQPSLLVAPSSTHQPHHRETHSASPPTMTAAHQLVDFSGTASVSAAVIPDKADSRVAIESRIEVDVDSGGGDPVGLSALDGAEPEAPPVDETHDVIEQSYTQRSHGMGDIISPPPDFSPQIEIATPAEEKELVIPKPDRQRIGIEAIRLADLNGFRVRPAPLFDHVPLAPGDSADVPAFAPGTNTPVDQTRTEKLLDEWRKMSGCLYASDERCDDGLWEWDLFGTSWETGSHDVIPTLLGQSSERSGLLGDKADQPKGECRLETIIRGSQDLGPPEVKVILSALAPWGLCLLPSNTGTSVIFWEPIPFHLLLAPTDTKDDRKGRLESIIRQWESSVRHCCRTAKSRLSSSSSTADPVLAAADSAAAIAASDRDEVTAPITSILGCLEVPAMSRRVESAPSKNGTASSWAMFMIDLSQRSISVLYTCPPDLVGEEDHGHVQNYTDLRTGCEILTRAFHEVLSRDGTTLDDVSREEKGEVPITVFIGPSSVTIPPSMPRLSGIVAMHTVWICQKALLPAVSSSSRPQSPSEPSFLEHGERQPEDEDADADVMETEEVTWQRIALDLLEAVLDSMKVDEGFRNLRLELSHMGTGD